MFIPLLDHHVPKNKRSTLGSFTNFVSLWAFLLSILIYLSVFYLFSLSPWTLVCTTKFWFIISNTLVLIIAADFHDAFSSKNNKHDFYQHHYLTVPDDNGHDFKMNASATVPFHDLHKKMDMNSYDHQKQEVVQEKTIHIVVNYDHTRPVSRKKHGDGGNPNYENLRGMKKEEREMVVGVPEDDQPKVAKCVRTYSDRNVLISAAEEEGKEERAVLQRTVSERFEEEPRMEGNDEFSRMSVEELNRRVEEFITRFNRQMRLQGARTRQKSDWTSAKSD